MRLRGSTQQFGCQIEELSRRSRLLIQFVPAARTELINAQLIECEQGSQQVLYRYVEQTSPEFEDADDIQAQDSEVSE